MTLGRRTSFRNMVWSPKHLARQTRERKSEDKSPSTLLKKKYREKRCQTYVKPCQISRKSVWLIPSSYIACYKRMFVCLPRSLRTRHKHGREKERIMLFKWETRIHTPRRQKSASKHCSSWQLDGWLYRLPMHDACRNLQDAKAIIVQLPTEIQTVCGCVCVCVCGAYILGYSKWLSGF
jgi:hypothetical protein